jgi:hypothetical protein
MIISNRTAITVKVTQAFIDWFNTVDPSKNHKDYEPMILQDDDEGIVYLVPNWDMNEERDEILQYYYQGIFEMELSGWFTHQTLWPSPKERTFELFQKWFQVTHSSMIIDLLDEEIEREEL